MLPTPLHAAAVNGNKGLLQRLLQEGKYKIYNLYVLMYRCVTYITKICLFYICLYVSHSAFLTESAVWNE